MSDVQIAVMLFILTLGAFGFWLTTFRVPESQEQEATQETVGPQQFVTKAELEEILNAQQLVTKADLQELKRALLKEA